MLVQFYIRGTVIYLRITISRYMTPRCLNLYLQLRQVVTDDQENNTWSDVVLRVCDLMALGLLRISRSRLGPQQSQEWCLMLSEPLQVANFCGSPCNNFI